MKFGRLIFAQIIWLGSGVSHALSNGSEIDWREFDNIVYLSQPSRSDVNCIGHIVSGRYVLTSLKCLDLSEVQVLTRLNETRIIENIITFDVNSRLPPDIAIIVVNEPFSYSKVNFLKLDQVNEGEEVRLFGLDEQKDLTSITLRIKARSVDADLLEEEAPPYSVYAEPTSDNAYPNVSDIGSPWINQEGELVAIHNSSRVIFNGESVLREASATSITSFLDLISININGWHYPTSISIDGRFQVVLQSLHLNEAASTAYTEGDVAIINSQSSCLTKVIIEPFDTCSYVIESSGEPGRLYLSPRSYIDINQKSDESSENSVAEESGAGAMGLWFLVFFAMVRCWFLSRDKYD